jgi:hypothetical protein
VDEASIVIEDRLKLILYTEVLQYEIEIAGR